MLLFKTNDIDKIQDTQDVIFIEIIEATKNEATAYKSGKKSNSVNIVLVSTEFPTPELSKPGHHAYLSVEVINQSFDRHNAKRTEKAIVQCYAHSCK